jgi:hypothetical protein
MAAAGYTQGDHDHGWELLKSITGYQQAVLPNLADVEVRNAVLEIDAWDEDNFRIIRACLTHKHPAQGAYLFEGLEANKGLASVLGVERLLQRLDALESAPERAATRDADHAALATLAQRGYSAAERQRLAALVQLAKRGTQHSEPASAPAPTPSTAELDAYRYYNDWAETARVRIKRRDQLILLGLAKRRRAKEEEESGNSEQIRAPDAPL